MSIHLKLPRHEIITGMNVHLFIDLFFENRSNIMILLISQVKKKFKMLGRLIGLSDEKEEE